MLSVKHETPACMITRTISTVHRWPSIQRRNGLDPELVDVIRNSFISLDDDTL
jgi:hypothetical protein